MWISAGVAGAVLAGGVAVAATASAGRAERAGTERATPSYGPGRAPAEVPGTGVPKEALPTGDPSDFVVSTQLNPNPRDVAEYWTEERMQSAEPLPMPVITVKGGE
jgi:hypothetical protein